MEFPTFATAEEIPENFRPLYVKKDGKWAVELPAADVPDVTKLMAAIETERDRAKAAERAEKAASKALDEMKRTADARAKGISEEELQKIREAEALARKPIEEERDRLAADNRKLRLTDRVRAIYLANGGMPDRTDDAMDQLDKRTDLGDEGGIVYKGKDGKLTADSAGPFFTKFRAEKPWLFSGAGGSGSGAEGSTGSAESVAIPDPELAATRRRDIAGAF